LLALSALTSPKLGTRRLKKGDEVISVAAGFPTTVNPIIQQGLVPVFVDCEIGTYNIDATQIEAALSPKTKAIFIAHTLGNMFDMETILTICKKHNLWLIEDSCDALGAEWNSKKAGTIGHIGTYSFYPAHHLTMGEGGAVVTNDPALYRIILSFRDWGRDCWCKPGTDNTCKNRFNMQLGNLPFGYDHKYTYSHVGFNLKITDWQAAIGLSQIKKLPTYIQKRTDNAAYLTKALSDLQEYLILPRVHEGVKASWFGYLISVKPGAPFTKQQLVEYLEEHGIGTRQLFAGNFLRQPALVNDEIMLRIGNSPLLKSCDLTEKQYALLPNTEFIMNNTFWIGTFPALGENELARMSQAIHDFVKEKIK
jgi:CDP-6-deoxy-D-xylo-4-hexulose-3-dehydrase